ncbi:hypothetical protein [Paenibacillus sp. KS-LC4]|uniref:hypothetical protein n=1 Tax=Paenibacillus sp. KS-LC4 TaxID=2979727 RepID=UPI0030CAC683
MKKKLMAMLSTFILVAVLVLPASASAAVYVPPFEPDSASNPHIFSAGDWSFPTLTPGDKDYFKFTNTFSYTRTYTLIVDSPDGFNYVPGSINATGVQLINPVVQEFGYYRYDIVCNPGAVVNIEIGAQISGYSPNTYFIVII